VSCARANLVRVYDVPERREIAQIHTGAVPIGILIEPNGQRAFVANTAGDTVSVLSMDTYRVLMQLRTGRTPDGMAFVEGRENQKVEGRR
jgi:DNA-binding beta-propeller fold protein YncE